VVTLHEIKAFDIIPRTNSFLALAVPTIGAISLSESGQEPAVRFLRFVEWKRLKAVRGALPALTYTIDTIISQTA
jgi:hypothetical protein